MLLTPRAVPATPVLRAIIEHGDDPRALTASLRDLPLDLSPPTDDRPFFFNQLRLDQPWKWGRAMEDFRQRASRGVLMGNLVATATLALIILLSLLLVVVTIVLPMRSSLTDVPSRVARGGTAYFLLIGIGFMLVEMALLQRLSVFLGHPIYALSIVLFGLILFLGVGSYLSERIDIVSPGRYALWSAVLGIYLLSAPWWLPGVVSALADAGIVARAACSILIIAPAGVLMGFGFPVGMRLVMAVDSRPTPWLWGVNGAAGVLASGLAVAISMTWGIGATLSLGALCYLALIPAALALGFPRTDSVAAVPAYD